MAPVEQFGDVDNIKHRYEASGVRVLRHAMPGEKRDVLRGMAAVENNGNLTLCHSREGGNPFDVGKFYRAMDSRLRGNDN
jgi:hypothetical protein